MQVSVTEVTPTGAAMRWKQAGGGLFQSSLGSAMVEEMARLTRQIDDITIDYSVDEDGQRSLADATVRQETRFVYDPGTAWLVSVEANKTIDMAGQSRTDGTVIEAK